MTEPEKSINSIIELADYDTLAPGSINRHNIEYILNEDQENLNVSLSESYKPVIKKLTDFYIYDDNTSSKSYLYQSLENYNKSKNDVNLNKVLFEFLYQDIESLLNNFNKIRLQEAFGRTKTATTKTGEDKEKMNIPISKNCFRITLPNTQINNLGLTTQLKNYQISTYHHF